MSSDYLWDGTGPTDPEIRRLEQLLGRFRYKSVDVRISKWRSPKRLVPLALAASLLLAIGIAKKANHAPVAVSWQYQVLTGAPTIGAAPIAASGELRPGEWIETDGASRALLTLSHVGEIEIEPHTLIGLPATEDGNARLVLKRGTIQAVAASTPSQLEVETPTATALDNGGDYVLTVDDSGGATLCVSDGSVSFESRGRQSIVPAGAVCETRPGIGPGTPRCENGTDHFRIALERYDFVSFTADALSGVLHESGPCDLLPLWHILRRADSSDRGRVFDRMTMFSPPPKGVTRDGILNLDHTMLQYWWSEIRSNRACLLCSESVETPSS